MPGPARAGRHGYSPEWEPPARGFEAGYGSRPGQVQLLFLGGFASLFVMPTRPARLARTLTTVRPRPHPCGPASPQTMAGLAARGAAAPADLAAATLASGGRR